MQHVDFDNYSSDYEAIFQDDFINIDSSSDTEEILNSDSDEENKLLYLTKMGYSDAESSIAMERCGPDSSIAELTDFICADQMAEAANALLLVEDKKPLYNDPNYKKRQNSGSAKLTERICKALEAYDDEPPSSVQNDAEVAFYCLGISLETDVQELNDDRLEQLMSRFVEFDLVVGGIQRNNLTGRNKHHQDELEDFCWCIFLQ
ncbi:hypothetical protein F3Y22_tig00117032pilonHSYRG00281 [Hibiscus syriacus]|uniref:DNA (Cytosine-5)-methyltransferase DRM1/2 n=1 Tax=Hibiscus syriacus TaxID=106335 RepID=A0A6A2X0F6_HIBSY|nr:hypothetical protein F3Y22_tig00117032pilonHSYRG00281 [Hibiscus syriacus]